MLICKEKLKTCFEQQYHWNDIITEVITLKHFILMEKYWYLL